MTYPITIAGGAVTIVNNILPGARISTSYSTTLTATGGTAPYQWTVVNGSLPPGLSLGQTSGILSGTPTTSGSTSFSIQAKESGGQTGFGYYYFTVSSGTISISPTASPAPRQALLTQPPSPPPAGPRPTPGWRATRCRRA